MLTISQELRPSSPRSLSTRSIAKRRARGALALPEGVWHGKTWRMRPTRSVEASMSNYLVLPGDKETVTSDPQAGRSLCLSGPDRPSPRPPPGFVPSHSAAGWNSTTVRSQAQPPAGTRSAGGVKRFGEVRTSHNPVHANRSRIRFLELHARFIITGDVFERPSQKLFRLSSLNSRHSTPLLTLPLLHPERARAGRLLPGSSPAPACAPWRNPSPDWLRGGGSPVPAGTS